MPDSSANRGRSLRGRRGSPGSLSAVPSCRRARREPSFVTPAPTAAATSAESRWRDVAAGPIIAAVTLAIALIVTGAAGVPLRDPHGVFLKRLLTAAALVVVLIGI